jgi:PAS domain S-box-containing protein
MSVSEPLIQASLLGEAIFHGPVAVLVADERGRYIAVNELGTELLGYTRDELLTMTITDVARYPEAKAEFGRLRKAGSGEGRATLTRKDGTTVDVSYRSGVTKVAQMQVWVAVMWPETALVSACA